MMPSPKSYLLGLFVVGHIVFLALSNTIGWLQDVRDDMSEPGKEVLKTATADWGGKHGHLWEATHTVHDITRRYAEATGQFQTWSLFAPSIGRECIFLTLELNRDDGGKPIRLLSENEPSDLNDYLRLGKFRLRRIENNLTVTLRPWEEETEEDRKKRWAGKINEFLDEYERILAAYLKWRVAEWGKEHPDEAQPKTVTLIMRRFHVNDVDSERYWEGPFEVPVGVFGLSSGRFVERFDPITDRMNKVSP